MESYQIAKLLQIIGLLIGTGFGTILLNPEMLGRIGHRINVTFLNLGNSVAEGYLAFLNVIAPGGIVRHGISEAIGSSLGVFLVWVTVPISLKWDIPWLLWTGFGTLTFLALVATIDSVIRFFIRFPGKYPIWFFPVLLVVRPITALVFFPIIAVLLTITNYVFLAIVYVFSDFAGRDIVRRGLIIIGFLLILTGLIMELLGS